MLSDWEKDRLAKALPGLQDTNGPWAGLAPLADLARHGTRVSIDFTTTQTLGAPVIIAERAAPPHLPGLTARQQQVCAALAQGQSNKSIARTLGISPATVKDHVHAILTRLGLSSRTEIIAYLHGNRG